MSQNNYHSSPAAPDPAPVRRHSASIFATSAGSVADAFAATEGMDGFAVSRMTDRWWTGLAAGQQHRDALVEWRLPVSSSVCYYLLAGGRPVYVADMAHHRLPAVRAIAHGFGTATYVTAPLRPPDGRVLGSVCGWSTAASAHRDPAGLLRRLETAAEHLTGQLVAALDAEAEERRGDLDRALVTADPVTGLPDRRGWALLLRAEEERARQLATPVSIVVVDAGVVRTARGLRRAGQNVREVAKDLPVSRMWGARFVVLASGMDDPVALAGAVCAEMVIAGYRGAVGSATREPAEGLKQTWARAEDAALKSGSGPRSGLDGCD